MDRLKDLSVTLNWLLPTTGRKILTLRRNITSFNLNLWELKSKIPRDSMSSTLPLWLMTLNGKESMRTKVQILDFSGVSTKKEPFLVERSLKWSLNTHLT